MNRPLPDAVTKTVRCAVYTRKSTEEGLSQEFNSLSAQREAAEAYIASLQSEGWRCLPDRYDDGGFTGSNMDRPALGQLLHDIQAGQIDCVAVYKVDRLSRSLLDFAKMMETFDKYRVSFVSVTQQFNSATSMGRLVLNILLSFAQFEREIISERTRDKIAATRRKGKWAGGIPLLGYDLVPRSTKLKVNSKEAARVRAIFELYLEYRALLPVVRELERRRWRTKRWRNRHGHLRGGRKFTKTSLHRLLTNVTYIGKVRYKNELHLGEQPAVVAPEIWQRVQQLLQDKRTTACGAVGHRSEALLQGLLRCAPCGCAMTPTCSVHGSKRYRYYLCCGAHRRGRQSCPSKSIPALAIEQAVLEQIQNFAHDSATADLDVRAAAAAEQFCLVRRLIDRVDYDGAQNKMSITFRTDRLEPMFEEPAASTKEKHP